MFTLDRKTASSEDVVRLENSHLVATLSAATGTLQEMTLKDSGDVVKTNLQFVQYGTRPGKERSGAYLFLPDGEAKVRFYHGCIYIYIYSSLYSLATELINILWHPLAANQYGGP